MSDVAEWATRLRDTEGVERVRFLTEHSGLPGPRANLSLVHAAAAVADEAMIASLLSDGGEYPVTCAAAAIGSEADDSAREQEARRLAADPRWRVREGVVIGLQLLGDRTIVSLVSVVRRWALIPDPLVQRAAVAAICEPRLLRTSDATAAALDVCRTTTTGLAGLSPERRKTPDVRTLRQALGYCWSVAIAADPDNGLVLFRALDIEQPDIAWIVAANLRKKRLAALV